MKYRKSVGKRTLKEKEERGRSIQGEVNEKKDYTHMYSSNNSMFCVCTYVHMCKYVSLSVCVCVYMIEIKLTNVIDIGE